MSDLSMDELRQELEGFVGKIDHEGGVYSALEYGLDSFSYDIPKEVAEKWSELREVFYDAENIVSEFWTLVTRYGVEY